jgi:hypothetical protein
MIIHNPILTGSFTVNGTDVSSITSSAASLTSLNAYTASQNNRNGTYATTGSNTFAGIQTVNSNLVVTGSITAQTLVVQTITSSVDFVTGSTRFGSLAANTHVFTGSMSVSGSATFLNNINTGGDINNTSVNNFIINSNGGVLIGIDQNNDQTDRVFAVYNNGETSNQLFRVQEDGKVGIGTSSPAALLETRVAGESPATGKIALIAATSNGINDIFRWYDNTTQLGVFKNSGNVGIGTTTADSRLSLYESTGTTTSTMELATSGNAYKGRFGMFANNFYITSNWYYNGTQNADNLSYGQGSITFGGGGTIDFQTSAAGNTSPTTRMRITSAGNVGIGTTPGAWVSPFTVIEGGSYGQHVGFQSNGPDLKIGTNNYYNGSGYLYAVSSNGAMQFNVGGNSGFQFNIAPSGTAGTTVTFTTAFSITAGSGRLYSTPTYDNTYGASANMYIASDGNIGRATSSSKYKTNINDYDKGLDIVSQLRPVYYNSKNPIEEGKLFAGLIAEEIEDLGLTEFVQYAEDGTPDALAYGNMVTLAFKAIQELQAQINELKNK